MSGAETLAMHTAVINANAYGVWKRRIGERVTIVAVTGNGRATGILTERATKPAFVPTCWLDREGNA